MRTAPDAGPNEQKSNLGQLIVDRTRCIVACFGNVVVPHNLDTCRQQLPSPQTGMRHTSLRLDGHHTRLIKALRAGISRLMLALQTVENGGDILSDPMRPWGNLQIDSQPDPLNGTKGVQCSPHDSEILRRHKRAEVFIDGVHDGQWDGPIAMRSLLVVLMDNSKYNIPRY